MVKCLQLNLKELNKLLRGNGVWAGGDCVSGGEDLTVTAVAQGRDAAEDINLSLMG